MSANGRRQDTGALWWQVAHPEGVREGFLEEVTLRKDLEDKIIPQTEEHLELRRPSGATWPWNE